MFFCSTTYGLAFVALEVRPEDDRLGLVAGADVDRVPAQEELRLGLAVEHGDGLELDALERGVGGGLPGPAVQPSPAPRRRR